MSEPQLKITPEMVEYKLVMSAKIYPLSNTEL